MRNVVFMVLLIISPVLFARRTKAEVDLGPRVLILDPSTPDAQAKVDAIFHQQEKNQFGLDRQAILLKPGRYDLDMQVGFYTSVLGLGKQPGDVTVDGAVRTTARWMKGNATCNFWRCVENLAIEPHGGTNVWAVSQGTDLRRLVVHGNLNLWDEGWSSGGFCADCRIDGQIVSGSQQQWLSRNCSWGQWQGGVWNMVFVGVDAPPKGNWPKQPFTTAPETPTGREKPFLFVDKTDKWFVHLPAFSNASTRGSSGKSEKRDLTPLGLDVSIDDFFVAHPSDSSDAINAALTVGKNVLFTPGIYRLTHSLAVTRADTIVMGIGYATLVPTSAEPAIVVSDVDGVTIAGLIFEAGETKTPTLLQVGPSDAKQSHAKNPTCLFDIVARCGGSMPGVTASFVTINSSDVIGDNLWLWRADHGAGAGWETNPVANGIIVNGPDVTIYGLFVEHCQEYQTLWNGNDGRVYFYQSELPYDVPSQEKWSHDGVNGFASYKVADKVTSHEAWGLGVYSFFTDAAVVLENAVETPVSDGVKIHNVCAVRLGGKAGSGITHVINGRGEGRTNVEPVRVSE